MGICLFLDAYFLNTKHILLLRKLSSPQVGGIDSRASAWDRSSSFTTAWRMHKNTATATLCKWYCTHCRSSHVARDIFRSLPFPGHSFFLTHFRKETASLYIISESTSNPVNESNKSQNSNHEASIESTRTHGGLNPWMRPDPMRWSGLSGPGSHFFRTVAMLSVLPLWLTMCRCFSTLCLLSAFSLVPFSR